VDNHLYRLTPRCGTLVTGIATGFVTTLVLDFAPVAQDRGLARFEDNVCTILRCLNLHLEFF
jgi:hypothetical protein